MKQALALFLLFIGVVFLGIELDLWSREVASYFWQSWPFLLIFLGLLLVFKGFKCISLIAGFFIIIFIIVMFYFPFF